ncbi:MAG: VIT and VWA domain-containing protein [Planctomycetes bacterium]|nr:VIT and VWA domain-containing protein [Planctomycetota bacterium]
MTNLKSILATLLLLLMAANAFADGFIIIERPPRPEPEFRDYFSLEVKYHNVTVEINDSVATTSVDQVFHNPSPQVLEGTYIFPLPKDAAVGQFSLWIGDEEVQGEVLERNEARSIYEGIVRRMQDPALLEYIGQGAFKARVFPIPARGDRRIKLSYTQVLNPENGFMQYRYPLNTEKFSARPLDNCLIDVNVNSQIGIGFIDSPSHECESERKDDHHARVTFERTNVRPDKDFIVNIGLRQDEIGLTLDTYRRPGDRDGYFLCMIAPQVEVKQEDIIAKDVVFVLDTSGSMAGDKIQQAKKALLYCVQSLAEKDRFGLITFSTRTNLYSDRLKDASSANVDDAVAYIEERVRAAGGTDINGAILSALAMNDGSDRPFYVVFITDGKPTLGDETDPARIIANVNRANTHNARIYTFGIDEDLSVNLLERMAADNRGTTSFVTGSEDIEVVVSNFFQKVSSPVLTDVKVEFVGIKTYDTYPTELGDIFHGEQIAMFGRYEDSGDKAIKLTGTVNGESVEFVFEQKFTGERNDHDYVARLWAQRKIAYLIDEIRLHGENRELVDEIIALSRDFGLMSPYTSYLVVEDDMTTTTRPPMQQPRRDGRWGGGREQTGANAPDAPTPPATTTAPGGRLGELLRQSLGGQQDQAEAQAGSGGASARPAEPAENGSADDFGRRLSNELRGRTEGERGIVASEENRRNRERTNLDEQSEEEREVVRTIGDKTFFLLEGRWTDSLYTANFRGEVKKIVAYSDEYFELLDKEGISQYLSLGTRMLVVVDGVAYEIVPE